MLDRFLKSYYFSTPLWWLADRLWGVNLRAAGFESLPHLKSVYYGLCVLCALVIWLKPTWITVVALAESSVNILSLILGILGLIWHFAEVADMPDPLKTPIVGDC